MDVQSGGRPIEGVAKASSASPLRFARIAGEAVARLDGLGPLGPCPLVSVVMTTFNSAEFVEAAIRSLLAQTYWHIEVIVVDDMSVDDTRLVVSRLAKEDERVRLATFGENRGTYFCKNLGITLANGQVITFMDSDDLSHADRIATQVEMLRSPGCIVSTCSYQKLQDDGRLVGQKGRRAFISQMLRREVFDVIGYFDSVRTSADDEFLRRVRLAFGEGAHHNTPTPLYIARVRKGSLSHHPDNPKYSKETGGLSPARQNYIRAADAFHSAIRDAGCTVYMPFPLMARPFEVDPKLRLDAKEVAQGLLTAVVDARSVGQADAVTLARSLAGWVDHVIVIGCPAPAQSLPATHWIPAPFPDGEWFDGVEVAAGQVFLLDAGLAIDRRFIEQASLWLELLGRHAVVGASLQHEDGRLRIVDGLLAGAAAFHTGLLAREQSSLRLSSQAIAQAPHVGVPALTWAVHRLPSQNTVLPSQSAPGMLEGLRSWLDFGGAAQPAYAVEGLRQPAVGQSVESPVPGGTAFPEARVRGEDAPEARATAGKPRIQEPVTAYGEAVSKRARLRGAAGSARRLAALVMGMWARSEQAILLAAAVVALVGLGVFAAAFGALVGLFVAGSVLFQSVVLAFIARRVRLAATGAVAQAGLRSALIAELRTLRALVTKAGSAPGDGRPDSAAANAPKGRPATRISRADSAAVSDPAAALHAKVFPYLAAGDARSALSEWVLESSSHAATWEPARVEAVTVSLISASAGAGRARAYLAARGSIAARVRRLLRCDAETGDAQFHAAAVRYLQSLENPSPMPQTAQDPTPR